MRWCGQKDEFHLADRGSVVPNSAADVRDSSRICTAFLVYRPPSLRVFVKACIPIIEQKNNTPSDRARVIAAGMEAVIRV